ncbi:serine protease easter-like [Anoplophora glabripennis]|uniref:serine protease easter-like n=1 Tax=Anoplophora glabripennis TaxID=217634 RepID=UPI000874413E|nr:serine protease easter-like [Anoplophora glabripennis]
MREFLEISHCGIDKKNQPMVWCSQLNFCVTPQNKNGTCTPMTKCKHFLKLRSTLDASDPEADNFLNKFRCNEILEESHVCCQNEPLEYRNGDTNFRPTTTQPKPTIHGRSSYSDYDYYDWNNGRSFDYPNAHDYYDTFQAHHHKIDSSSGEKHETWNNKWGVQKSTFESGNGKSDNRPNKKLNQYGENDYRYQKDPDNFHFYDYSNNKEILDNSNKPNRGPNDNTTPKNKDIPISYSTQASSYKPTSKKRNVGTRSDENTVNKQKNWTTQQPTLSTRRTTPPSYDPTTTKRSDFDFNVGEGDIIFEDRFEDILKGQSRSTTEESTRSSERREAGQEGKRKSCVTPDGKPGICTRTNTCQRYTILQNNLDRSLKSVRDYLDKFKCKSSDEICCQEDEEKAIDNSVFNIERTNGNIPEPISKICGRLEFGTDRIVGGSVADLGEFPWLALLQYPSNRGIQSGCGGTLINSRYVVTAAHCVDMQILKNRGLGQVRQIVLGEYDTRNKTDCIYMGTGQDCADPPEIYGVESIIPHKMYTSSATQHDIALLRLDKEVTFTDYIKPICLPTKSSTLKGNETFIIAGWGRTSTDMFSPLLRKAKIPLVAKENCNRRNRSLIDGQICAGLGNGTDSCNGDSGGPLMLQVNNNFEFVTNMMGVISYGFLGCGRGPSINTYVPYYVDWINENMNF